MDFRTLRELVRQGEGKQLEFKLKTNHPEKIVREIVAFANSDGGKLLVGIGDDRSIKGLKYSDEDEYILTRAIQKYCFPEIEYTIERIAVTDEREVLVFNIPPSKGKPHYVLQEAEASTYSKYVAFTTPKKWVSSPVKSQSLPVKKAYIRIADKSVQASWEMREILRRSRDERNIQFRYGDKERKLMQHLDQHKSITVEMFATTANIPRKIASKTLVLLVLANVLRVHPDETVDRFTMVGG
jgi:predicted HTH transcriptional regulator